MTTGQKRKKANLRNVAKLADVSVATVSRVLNSPEVVQKTTRERVEKAIEELGFHPSAAARAINSGRTKIIGALVPTLDSDIWALTIDAIENRLEDFGFSLVVATTGDDPEKEARRAKELLDIGVEGLFLSGLAHSDDLFALIDRTRVPAVVTSYYAPEFRYPTIGYDNRHAAQLALDHLVALGHKKITVVHGPIRHNDRTRERVAGASSAHPDIHLTCFETPLTVAGGAEAAMRANQANLDIDAFLCLSDIQAFGVLFELQRIGLSAPNDVSVMGIQDLPGAQSTFPRLSTVRLPSQQMGDHAAKALALWVENGTRPQSVCLASELKVRETTGPKIASRSLG